MVGGPLSYGTSPAWPRTGRRVPPSFGQIGWPWSLRRSPIGGLKTACEGLQSLREVIHLVVARGKMALDDFVQLLGGQRCYPACGQTGVDSFFQCRLKGHSALRLGCVGPYSIYGDRIPSTTPGAEPPRDARDSGSARSHSTHLETSSSDRPKWSPTRSSTRYQDQISVTCTRWTLRMPSFTRATHAQPSLSNFTRRDSNFGERTRSRGTTLGERNFPTSPQNKKTKLTHCSIYVPMRTISTSHAK